MLYYGRKEKEANKLVEQQFDKIIANDKDYFVVYFQVANEALRIKKITKSLKNLLNSEYQDEQVDKMAGFLLDIVMTPNGHSKLLSNYLLELSK